MATPLILLAFWSLFMEYDYLAGTFTWTVAETGTTLAAASCRWYCLAMLALCESKTLAFLLIWYESDLFWKFCWACMTCYWVNFGAACLMSSLSLACGFVRPILGAEASWGVPIGRPIAEKSPPEVVLCRVALSRLLLAPSENSLAMTFSLASF